MRILTFPLLSLALCALSLPAVAADLPTKAPIFTAYPEGGCGAYYGLNALGSAAPITNGPIGGNVVGGAIGGTLGYTCAVANSPNFWFVEIMGDFQNLNGGTNGLALTGPAHIEERIAFGGPINQLLSVLPGLNFPSVPSLPALPNGITAGPQKGYVFASLSQDDISAQFGLANARQWSLTPGVGVGMLSRLSNGVVADVFVEATMQSQAVCFGSLPGQCPKLGTGWRTGLALKF